MPYFRQFDNIYDAGDEWDRISAMKKTCASMLFFRYKNGAFGGGPYWVWSSDEGEAVSIAKSIKITGLTRDQMPERLLVRKYFANWRAATRVDQPDYRPRGHSEEFLLHDFAACLGMVGINEVDKAYISITWSPCIGQLDSTPSENYGAARGCYNKLLLLAVRHQTLHFNVSFKEPFGYFSGQGDQAAHWLNTNRLTDNIEFAYAPKTG